MDDAKCDHCRTINPVGGVRVIELGTKVAIDRWGSLRIDLCPVCSGMLGTNDFVYSGIADRAATDLAFGINLIRKDIAAAKGA